MSPPARLFIASVGNPGSLYNTLHSAGHHLLDNIRALVDYPPFSSSGLSDSGSSHALYKSSSYMNTSGPGIYRAYRAWKSDLAPADQRMTRLLVVHDELELKLGQLKRRSPGSSLKGHNGLKSIAMSASGRDFTRLAIGIGRPESRQPKDVEAFVLRQMTSREKEAIRSRTEDAVDMIDELAREVGIEVEKADKQSEAKREQRQIQEQLHAYDQQQKRQGEESRDGHGGQGETGRRRRK